LDVTVAIPVPDEAGRAEILGKMIRQLIARHEMAGFRMFAGDVDPAELAPREPHVMTGADLKEVLRWVQLASAIPEDRTGAAPPISQEDQMRGTAAVG
jgi:transitional endoplasmic reticulum ATPase